MNTRIANTASVYGFSFAAVAGRIVHSSGSAHTQRSPTESISLRSAAATSSWSNQQSEVLCLTGVTRSTRAATRESARTFPARVPIPEEFYRDRIGSVWQTVHITRRREQSWRHEVYPERFVVIRRVYRSCCALNLSLLGERVSFIYWLCGS